MRLLPLILLAILTQAFGNVMLSRGMKEVGIAISADLEAARYFSVALTTVSNPFFLLGLVLLITAFLLFLTLLSRADLSYVVPITSFSYVLIALMAVHLLKESIPLTRWCGIVCICGGVLLVSRGESATASKAAKVEAGLEREI
jgi:multidrug transporter EmrE-like cation transporter